MHHLIAILMLLANLTTCARLLLYRRAGARYRPLVSACAWVLIAASGSTALGILLGMYPPADIHLGDLGISLVVATLSLAARGNVADIIRTHHDQPQHAPRG
jgi:hypothetical protein